jgi:hypothetical protein
MKCTYVAMCQEYIKAPKDKYLLVFLHSALGTCKARYRIKIHAKAWENRLTIKSKMSNIIVTLSYTVSCYCTHWRPVQLSSSSSSAPSLVLLSWCSVSQSQLLQVVHWLTTSCESYRFTLHHLVLPASAIGPKERGHVEESINNWYESRSHGFGTKSKSKLSI